MIVKNKMIVSTRCAWVGHLPTYDGRAAATTGPRPWRNAGAHALSGRFERDIQNDEPHDNCLLIIIITILLLENYSTR